MAQTQLFQGSLPVDFAGSTPGASVVGTQQAAQVQEQLFTQAQVNGIVAGRVNQLNQKITELTTQLEQMTTSYNTTFQELTGYKQRSVATKAGVPEHMLDYAVFMANKGAVNGKTFDVSLQEWVSNNSQLLGVSNQAAQSTQATTPAQGQTTQGVANPAQQTPQQSTFGLTPAQIAKLGTPSQPAGVSQPAGTVQMAGAMPPAGVTPPVQPATAVTQPVQVQLPGSQPAQVQFGQTGASGFAGSLSGVGNEAAIVNTFLKERGLIR